MTLWCDRHSAFVRLGRAGREKDGSGMGWDATDVTIATSFGEAELHG